jgi:hypothetical protein
MGKGRRGAREGEVAKALAKALAGASKMYFCFFV